jgi:hypothetical protein
MLRHPDSIHASRLIPCGSSDAATFWPTGPSRSRCACVVAKRNGKSNSMNFGSNPAIGALAVSTISSIISRSPLPS